MARRPECCSLSLIVKNRAMNARARKNAMPANKVMVDLFYRQTRDPHHLDLLTKFLRSLLEQLENTARRILDERLIKQDALLDKAIELAVERLLARDFRHILYFLFKHRAGRRRIRIRHFFAIDPDRIHC